MRLRFFIGLMIVSVLISCKKDEEKASETNNDSNSNVVNVDCGYKKLKSLTMKSFVRQASDSIFYEYDANCRLIKASSANCSMKYEYSNSTVDCIYPAVLNTTNTYELIGNSFLGSLVKSTNAKSKSKRLYNNEGYLISVFDSTASKSFYIYNKLNFKYVDGNMMFYEFIDSTVDMTTLAPSVRKYICQFEYADTLKKGNYYQAEERYYLGGPYHHGLFGKTNKNLIRSLKMITEEGSLVEDLKYELDKDGYVVKETRFINGMKWEEYGYRYY